MIRIVILAITFSLMLTSTALAKDFYFGAQINNNYADEDELKSANITIGKFLTENFSIEGRFGYGFGEQSKQSEFAEFEISSAFSIKDQFGLYAKYHFTPLEGNLRFFGIAGYSKIKIAGNSVLNDRLDDEVTYSSFTDTEGGFSYGIGVAYDISQSFSITVDYLRLVDANSDIRHVNGLGIGVSRHF